MDAEATLQSLSFADKLLCESRLSTVTNGNSELRYDYSTPTSTQKWWISIVLGIIFMFVSSDLWVKVTESYMKEISIYTHYLQVILFVFIIRLLLW